jgi:hypothetical protein
VAQTIKPSVAADKRRAAIDRTRGRLTERAGGRSLVDELIAERRTEALGETTPAQASRRRPRAER